VEESYQLPRGVGAWDHRRQRSASNAVSTSPSRPSCVSRVLNILFVGPERPDEFANAIQLMRRGHTVIAVNPRETHASRAFQERGGTFLATRIEQLPRACGAFDLILENYPYPSGQDYVPPRPYALARLSRLAQRGRWILFTEAVRFATLLTAAVQHDDHLRGKFHISLAPLSVNAAPPSYYPPVDSRFRLIFERPG
jgi:hypothetical protein